MKGPRSTMQMRLTAVLAVATCCAWPAGAHAQVQTLESVSQSLTALGVKLETLSKEASDPDVLGGGRRFLERLSSAEILFLLKDYERASLILYDLAGRDIYRSRPAYQKVVYTLAESLFQMEHWVAARRFFRECLKFPKPDYRVDSVKRLIQVADRLGDWASLDVYISKARSSGGLPPQVRYLQAKSLLRQKKFSRVFDFVGQFPSEHRLAPKAKYLAGVAAVEIGDLDQAFRIFGELTSVKDTFEDAKEIRDLAHMNQGRILYEKGELAESVNAYQGVERTSSRFSEALYEVTWIFVRAAQQAPDYQQKRAEYHKAINSLEIMLLSGEENPLMPEARLLMGNILLQDGDFDRASEAFEEIIGRYGAFDKELSEVDVANLDPFDYFDQISGKKTASGSGLPKVALQWQSGKHSLQRALSVNQDLDASLKWLADARGVAEGILEALESDEVTSLFPTIQGLHVRVFTIRAELVGLNRELLDRERQLLSPYATAPQKKRLQEIQTRRAELEPKYAKLPSDVKGFLQKGRAAEGNAKALEKRLVSLRVTIGGMKRQLTELQIWMKSQEQDFDARSKREYLDRIDQATREVEEMVRYEEDLANQIRNLGMLMQRSGNDAGELVRQAYYENLGEEGELLGEIRQSAPNANDPQLNRIEELRGRLARQYVDASRIDDRLNDAVQERALDIKAEILAELGVLDDYEQKLQSDSGWARGVVGDIARNSLRDVRDSFHDVILRADVGIVDVAWRLKEEKTQEINARVSEQREALKSLQNEFEDFLND